MPAKSNRSWLGGDKDPKKPEEKEKDSKDNVVTPTANHQKYQVVDGKEVGHVNCYCSATANHPA